MIKLKNTSLRRPQWNGFLLTICWFIAKLAHPLYLTTDNETRHYMQFILKSFVDLLENHSWAFSKWTLIAASVILVMGHPATGHLKTWRVGREGPGSVVGALRTATAAGSPSTDELGSSTRSLKASVLLLSSSRPSSPNRHPQPPQRAPPPPSLRGQ